jgi:hypothetical protein
MRQVRKPRKPARLANLGAASSSSAAAAVGASASINGVPRLNAAHHPGLEWPEFGYLLDKVAAAARLASRQAGRAAADAGTTQTGAVLDWGGAAAAAAAEAAALGADGDEAAAAAGEDAGECGDCCRWPPWCCAQSLRARRCSTGASRQRLLLCGTHTYTQPTGVVVAAMRTMSVEALTRQVGRLACVAGCGAGLEGWVGALGLRASPPLR